MRRIQRGALALLLGLSLGLGVVNATAAQELPTGAARVVEKVQTHIFISRASLTTHVGKIQANHPLPGPAAPAP